ncbi:MULTISPECIES: NAD-dependent epimerase/dehydratase family protein [Actinoalloteichus]|uniref:Nucleoside-diphosphate-sugar epimerase n=1 Tax=Actinoalloteichus fjordicus TaxID=1612552 RepID=A0AAC9LCX3_9PSEU|nr:MULTISPECIES: SDR family NAD(P)-dependent oxidoreductase [Actinoalloteichus]APU15538.1 nucleoside-diphosphate-sugar epimerase [Actinoalloteichus fjordicus]APU21605.1 nucleoside-diphosphate-sugar epimerase [Actinoalloteichus sp. GBA129-24]
MVRALVTGGCGFIGTHLVRRLLADGDEVTVVDIATPPDSLGADGGRVGHLRIDIRDRDALQEAVSASEVDVVYHLAAVVGVDQYLARPLDVIDINLNGTRNVLDLARRSGARVVVASTSEVFGKNPAVPWAEDGDRVLGPTSADRWAYSSSKALMEHLAFAYIREHRLDASIVRYFNVYGPGQRPAYVVSRSIHRALNGHDMVVYDRGDQTRCFTYVDDVVDGTILAARNPAATGEAFNIGSMDEATVAEVVTLIAAATGASWTSVDTAAHLGSAYEDLPRRVPDNAKARRLLGWEPTTGLDAGLAKTVEWARRTPAWLGRPDTGAA